MSTIEVPRLRPSLGVIFLFLAVLGVALAVVTVLVDADTSLWTRIAVVVAVSAVLPIAYLILFVCRWVWAHRGRSLALPGLEQSLSNEQAERTGLAARVALALGITPLPASKLVRQEASIKLLLPVDSQAGLEISDVLLLVDQRGPLARAEVDALDTTSAEASITWFADPVAKAWYMENLSPLGLDLPKGTHVLSESALRRRLEQLAQEEGTDG